jgi:hypothetical protein
MRGIAEPVEGQTRGDREGEHEGDGELLGIAERER